jgi:hypothetical protein
MGMPHVTLVAPTFDDAQSVNLRVFIDDDGGGGCTIEFWVWDAIFKPGKFTRYASLPGKTTGSTVQNHTSVLGFKYQQSYFVRAINGADVFDTATLQYWPIRDNKLMDGQPWRIVSFAQVWASNVLDFVCTTDIHCHLFLAWSDHEPYIRKRAHQKRGTVLWHDGEHGLVVNGYVEQLQAGDTQLHTIQLPFPIGGGKRWWFLFGEVDGRRSTSRTPFYYDEYIPPVGTTVHCPMLGAPGNKKAFFYYRSTWSLTFTESTNEPLATWFGANIGGVMHTFYTSYWLTRNFIMRTAALFDTSLVPLGKTITAVNLRSFADSGLGVNGLTTWLDDSIGVYSIPVLQDPPVDSDYGLIHAAPGPLASFDAIASTFEDMDLPLSLAFGDFINKGPGAKTVMAFAMGRDRSGQFPGIYKGTGVAQPDHGTPPELPWLEVTYV